VSLWLCLRFEQLPLQCLNRTEDVPVVVMAQQRVLRVNDCAAALGIKQGMTSATVRALADEQAMQLLERDTTQERHCLQELCCWAYSITPTLHTWREDCLQLEIGGCLELFRGLNALLQAVKNGLATRGYRAEYALAATPRAAWLLSFIEEEVALDITRPLEKRLAPLPLKLLDEFPKVVASLRRAGLHTLGDIMALPPNALGRRCGKAFVTVLQQVLGQENDLRPDYQPPASFRDAYWFGYEVKANDELLPAVQLLLKSLCQFLRNTQLRTTEINWQLVGLDQKLQTVCVRSTSSHSDWESWYQLTRIRLDQLQRQTSVEGLNLTCDELNASQLDNIDLFSTAYQREPLASLLDRLRNRLGQEAIQQVGCREEHVPECALHVSSEISREDTRDMKHCKQRPFWLMPEPEPLRNRGKRLFWNGALELIYGPERIEDNWWFEPVCRDYYIAQGQAGQYYWVFRDRRAKQWYIQGLFA